MMDGIASLGVFVTAGLFLVLAVLESVRPALVLRQQLGTRWISNIGLYAINTGLAISLAAIGFSAFNPTVMAHSLGLFPMFAGQMAEGLQFLVALLVLDLINYASHRISHRLRWLWCLHGVHHADPDIDVTTAFRHHPGEAVVSGFIGLMASFALGIPLVYWAAYEVLAMAIGLIHHANLRLPEALDAALRWVVVTPGMHRHHHAVPRAIHDSNYGGALSVWDRLFGTYYTSSPAERDGQPAGLAALDTPADQRLDAVLLMPPRLFSRNSP